MSLKIYLLLTVLGSSLICSVAPAGMNLSTVSRLDVNRYMGKWYEIARLPHANEEGLHSITATYTLREDNTIGVLNRGYTDAGDLQEANGHAYRPDDADPGKLKVSFFLFFYGDYFVIELDDQDYQWALVSSGSGNYLWVLSRTSVMEKALYEELLQRARDRGFDLSQLIVVEQK